MFERADARRANELRPIEIIRNYTKHADGSVLIVYGDTKVLVTACVEERVPRHVFNSGADKSGWLTGEYSLLPGSTNTRSNRERNRVSGRTSEIQRLIGRSLRASIDLSKLGQRTITIDADVIQADGGTRCAAITGGYVAMMDALTNLQKKGLLEELPPITPIAAVSVGMIEDDIFLDLNYEEDFAADVDANIIMNSEDCIVEFQATSEGKPFTKAQQGLILDYAHEGIKELLELQRQALEEAIATS